MFLARKVVFRENSFILVLLIDIKTVIVFLRLKILGGWTEFSEKTENNILYGAWVINQKPQEFLPANFTKIYHFNFLFLQTRTGLDRQMKRHCYSVSSKVLALMLVFGYPPPNVTENTRDRETTTRKTAVKWSLELWLAVSAQCSVVQLSCDWLQCRDGGFYKW